MSKTTRPSLPQPFPQPYEPYSIDLQGWWLILSDLQMPFHDVRTIEAAVAEGRRQKVVGVLLNGDTLDFHEMSDYDRNPSFPRYRQERESGIQLLEYLRDRFPKAEIIWKDGNHEDRLARYIIKRAPALFGLEMVSMSSLMELERFDIPHIGDKRVIRLGKLNVLHGHEHTERQLASPVNPARGLFLKAKASAMCAHHHQTSEHHDPTITGKPIGCWSTGCLCCLTPAYRPLNRWNSGFALVKLDAAGSFHVRNLRIIDGKVM